MRLYSWNVNGIRAVIKKGTFLSIILKYGIAPNEQDIAERQSLAKLNRLIFGLISLKI